MTLAGQGLRERVAATPVTLRLWAAAVLTVLPLGLVWKQLPGTVTPGIVGPNFCDADGFCEPGIYTPGTYAPGATVYGSDSSARVFLIAAALLLIVVASSVRTAATRRLARLATGALAAAIVLALDSRAVLPTACVALALALVAGPVWRTGRRDPIFGRFAMPG